MPAKINKVAIAVLGYGDYPDLLERCLSSIVSTFDEPRVSRLRICLNAPSVKTRAVAELWARRAERIGKPVDVLVSFNNIGKYPAMRRAFYGTVSHTPLDDAYVAWFDDDSFIRPSADRPESLRETFWGPHLQLLDDRPRSLVGSIYRIPITRKQREWLVGQPWYAGVSFDASVAFCTGGWWIAGLQFLRLWNYPWPELHHNGGDVMLGQLYRQRGADLIQNLGGAAINADAEGRESKAPRRGLSTPPIGA